ncbi:GNAT family N-acetyltransferase [Demequina litorisediminis]|uniref:GNAT family N-acetyltransferase n=1 Tax=Demequina litorisediminis TaxID=1849022 RepID=UPI003D66506B
MCGWGSWTAGARWCSRRRSARSEDPWRRLQGVWVHPAVRGRGIARVGLARVADAIRATTAPTVSLYVNDFNVAAIAAYRAVGFREVGAFATVMF